MRFEPDWNLWRAEQMAYVNTWPSIFTRGPHAHERIVHTYWLIGENRRSVECNIIIIQLLLTSEVRVASKILFKGVARGKSQAAKIPNALVF
jgi:hypothetical protein